MKNTRHHTIVHWGHNEFKTNLNVVKNLRKVYQYYPYLYEYDETEENTYLTAYLQSGKALDAFVCLQNEVVVGISIGCPLTTSMPICQGLDKFIHKDEQAYYFGDVIILKSAWGQGIADQLYQKHIDFVTRNNYSSIVALLVQRDEDDPRKPSHYQPSKLWTKHGFIDTKQVTSYQWNTRSFSHAPPKPETHTMKVYKKIL